MENTQVKLKSAILSHNFSMVREILNSMPLEDIVDAISEISENEDKAIIFRCLSREIAADAFEYLPYEEQSSLLETLAGTELSSILNEMADDDRTRLFEELPGTVTRRLLSLLSDSEREKALILLGYPESSVGRLMTPHYVSVSPDLSVKQVLDHIRKFGSDSETLTMIYVVDEQGKLVDDIRMRLFLLAPLDSLVSDLMTNRFTALKAFDDQADAVSVFRNADLPALPVTDNEGHLIGIVTSDDILDVAEQEATEDIQKFGGLEALDLPYFKTPLLTMIKKRAGWLVILFLGEMLTASAMGYYEHELEKAVILALFVPLIISSGGNSGSQAATLIIRAMVLKELTLRDWWQVIRREFFSGITLGIILGSIGFLRIALWQQLGFFNYTEHWPLVALTIFLTLVGIVLWGTLSGSMIPFILHRFGFDPAASSAPFVATLVDVTGVVIYFSVAAYILRGTLL